MGLFSFSRSSKKYLDRQFQAIHQHVDFLHNDLFVLLRNYLKLDDGEAVELETRHPVAYESNDHLHPLGTVKDNTRCPKFFWKCEGMFPERERLRFLDMGCSSGGLVLDAILRGHFAIGLEGSDASLKEQRAQWRILSDRLFTCDITKEFFIRDRATRELKKFDVISMWDVLEHIAESDLPQLLNNIRTHLADGGIFVGSVSFSPSVHDGVELHVTRHEREWWEKTFADHGFEILPPFEPQFMPRGGFNPSHCYLPPIGLDPEHFGIAVRKRIHES